MACSNRAIRFPAGRSPSWFTWPASGSRSRANQRKPSPAILKFKKNFAWRLQAVGRKLGMYLRRRIKVKQEGERRNIFLRYLGEVATAVSDINRTNAKNLYDKLLLVAKKKTAEADTVLDERGKTIKDPEAEDYGGGVLIIDPLNDKTHAPCGCSRANTKASDIEVSQMIEAVLQVACVLNPEPQP